MIIWLASYPRSGNTLLRNIFKKSLELGTYSQHEMARELTEVQINDYGVLEYEGDWQNFYHTATNSEDTYFVKTHFLPSDNQPVIYVVRDGRLATESYLKQYQHRETKWPGIDSFVPNFYDLTIGRDYYSDWSYHFRAWSSRDKAQRLLLRYEDIVNPTMDTLNNISDFIRFDGKVKPFHNKRTQETNRKGERRGVSEWQRPEHRKPEEEALFISLHAKLMLELEYVDQAEVDEANALLDGLTIALGKSAMSTARERYQWMSQTIEKETVIQNLLRKNSENNPGTSVIAKIKRALNR